MAAAGDGRLEGLETGTLPLVAVVHPRELQRMARDGVWLGRQPARQLLPPPLPPQPPGQGLRFYLEEGGVGDRQQCLTLWTRRMEEELRRHPWRTSERAEASVLVLSGVETAFEMNWPHYGAFRRGDNWGVPGNDSHDRYCWRAANDERSLLRRVSWRRLDQALLVFDMHAGPQHYSSPDILVAGCDLSEMYARPRWDVGMPAMPHRVLYQPAAAAEGEDDKAFLLTFQGRATHPLRLELAALHDPSAGVVMRVVCVRPGQGESCLDQGHQQRSLQAEHTGE